MSPLEKEVWITVGTGAGLLLVGLAIGLVRGFRKQIAAWGFKLLEHEFPGKKDVQQHRAIYNSLVELRALTDADRAYVIRFHNGHEFLLSDPIWKCTCTHEVVRSGVTYESVNLQGLLVSRISELVEPILCAEYGGSGIVVGPKCGTCPFKPDCDRIHKNLAIIQVEEMASGFAKFMLQEENIKTVVMCGLTSKHGPFGIVGIDITSGPVKDEARLALMAEQVCRASEQIQYLFLKKELRKSHISSTKGISS